MLNSILRLIGIRRERSVDEIVSTFTTAVSELESKIAENDGRNVELLNARDEIDEERHALTKDTRRAVKFRDNLNQLIKE